jgi:glucose/arabinose dehydrogenase
MVGLFPIPGDERHALVLTQYDGIIYRAELTENGAAPTVFLDVQDRLIDDPGNEEGLLGLAFAPDYATSGRFFIYYSGGGPRRNVVERFVANGDRADPASGRIILDVQDPYENHNGGALAFGPDGMLYVALGDGGSGGDPLGNGQSLDALLGKILRIDVSGDTYTVPPDNPFVGSGRGEIWAYGLRNPWRIAFDGAALWAGDVGQNAWEEVNQITRGGNYGWNVMEGFECFRADSCDQTGLTMPRAVYGRDAGCSITGGYVYRGNAMPELQGWYLYSDYCSGTVWALDTRSADSEPIVLVPDGDQVASLAQDGAGELYLVTFSRQIQRIERND